MKRKKIKTLLQNPLTTALIIFFCLAFLVSILIFITESRLNISSYFEAFWWSIVTMSTTGYGDVIPETIKGKVIALVSMIIGIGASSLVTGAITSVYFNRLNKSQRGLMRYNKIKNHLIICGWKEDMPAMLTQIIKSNTKSFNSENIIIIANVSQSIIDSSLENSAFAGVKFVRGDCYDKNVLKRANAQHAAKAFVLADNASFDKTSGEPIMRTPFEIDSRTVMTVVSIKAINRGVYVCAQLLERNFESYLRLARCDDILFSKELTLSIISKTILQDGMSNIINTLLGIKNEKQSKEIQYNINCIPIKEEHIGHAYYDVLKEYISTATLALGVLENTGTYKKVTNLAMREAQKTANFTEMVQNLRQIKQLQAYNPVFIPDKNYAIPKYSSIILLEKKHA